MSERRPDDSALRLSRHRMPMACCRSSGALRTISFDSAYNAGHGVICVGSGRKFVLGEPAEACVRSVQIVADPPVFGQVSRMPVAGRQVLVEAFVPEPVDEALVLRQILFAGITRDLLDDLFYRILLCSGFPSHLPSLKGYDESKKPVLSVKPKLSHWP